ncbi:PREDICTED: embryogenesis-associated protein EMB8 isoform X1 [Brassica oleracea var. oleracea]|uniref:embryogenesis-associated protein EMB8 isoform X1 n=1 Tax=Brassica oleracea var. oleracea TaxID=109376 RepID=UPI0006A6CCC3|nr:PREDICTED: embryogenesis-associated protein EMB8 isoform X1 [Brassica oleracea var. oleracea]
MARLAFASSPPLASARTLRRHFSIFAAADPKTSEMPRLHHASLEVIGGGTDRFLPPLKDSLSKPYDAFPLIGFNSHAETIYAAFYRSVPFVRLRRECLRTKDNGSVALDWVAGDDSCLPPESPILILLPGLTGGSQDSYVRHMLLRARSKKWRCVVFNSRGCGDSPVTTPQFYSASFLGDISEVIAHVGDRFPRANLYAAGWSLGGNILVNYLAQESHNCTLSAAVSLCNPFDLVIADEDFHKGFNNVYDKALSRSLRRIFSKHSLLFEDIGGGFNIPMAANADTVRDFDEGLTRVSFGFKTVDEYYSKSSSSKAIKHVRIPLLCIQAANDPIAPDRGIPRKDIKCQANPNCMLIVTPRGGHLGWVAGERAPNGAPWTDPVVMEFLQHVESCETINGDRLLEDVHQIQV